MNEPYLGDLVKTQLIANLFAVPREQRDAKWVESFLDNARDASFVCADPQVLRGPDGFPYFVLNLPPSGKPFQCFVLRHMSGDVLLANGFGVVVEPGAGQPQWVFKYGDILGLHLKGDFTAFTDAPGARAGSEIIQEKEEVLLGQPSESYLPSTARETLRRFFSAQGINNANIVLMHRKQGGSVSRELVFDLDAEKVGDADLARNVMSRVGWFLPNGYAYCVVNHSTFSSSFAPL